MTIKELVTKIYSEITKVKVGDKVKLIKGGSILKHGKVYTVINTYPINKINNYKQSIVVYEENTEPQVQEQVISRNRVRKVWF